MEGSLRLLDILLTLAFSWFYDWHRPGVLCLSFRGAFLLKAPELLFVNFPILSVTDSLSFPVALLSGLDHFRDSLAGDWGIRWVAAIIWYRRNIQASESFGLYRLLLRNLILYRVSPQQVTVTALFLRGHVRHSKACRS